ncbi:phosphatases II [Triangularia verruculosa]|uniref:protein-tyrosine-phosphatase n=1 Tax=Triangularia verruculosa TaxID=2587418 RepID=A0AAN6X8I9_9PEZI|nr:phosphatases II [Triangularia verruculosa]
MAKKKNKPQQSPILASSSTLPSTVTPIPDFLFLSPASATSEKTTPSLLQNGITTIISVGKSPLFRHPDITYHRLPLLDSETASLGPTVVKACEIIDEVEKKRGKVLAHCSAGISRSPAVIAGYLIQRQGMTFEEAMEALKRGRGLVKPNKGFEEELRRMEGGAGADCEDVKVESPATPG